ncbi:MAG TPA: 23S rRNA (uridine(2552)-2'-O)-methyltransferase, partial [Methanosphaera sp.]|nr:23S rRNA (uridine(2552)-2'-O)-methyltransferase [Methanosphaera sp.]
VAVSNICDNILKKDGNLVMKAFQGEAYQDLVKNLKKKFRTVKTTKPNSSRKRSSEMYVIARGFKAPR